MARLLRECHRRHDRNERASSATTFLTVGRALTRPVRAQMNALIGAQAAGGVCMGISGIMYGLAGEIMPSVYRAWSQTIVNACVSPPPPPSSAHAMLTPLPSRPQRRLYRLRHRLDRHGLGHRARPCERLEVDLAHGPHHERRHPRRLHVLLLPAASHHQQTVAVGQDQDARLDRILPPDLGLGAPPHGPRLVVRPGLRLARPALVRPGRHRLRRLHCLRPVRCVLLILAFPSPRSPPSFPSLLSFAFLGLSRCSSG